MFAEELMSHDVFGNFPGGYLYRTYLLSRAKLMYHASHLVYLFSPDVI